MSPVKRVPTSASQIIGDPRPSAILLMIRVKDGWMVGWLDGRMAGTEKEAIEYARLSPGASWNMTYWPAFGYSFTISGHEYMSSYTSCVRSDFEMRVNWVLSIKKLPRLCGDLDFLQVFD
jgi:hypothetical protein